MKLISCYVENYGKIKKQDFVFGENLVCFCEENGFGKTTLASFLKAMFYGLEPYRSNSRDFCERMHFCPFDGGKFGGNVTFEMGGKTYKIERFFGEKSDTQDECAVYSDGKRTEKAGEDIGRAVFGIDAKSFERTAFISGDGIEISSTASINAKLNSFIEGEDDGLENALKILESARKEYKKSRTGNDMISAEKTEIERLNREITNAQNIRAALGAKYARYAENREKIASAEKRAEKARTVGIVLKDWEIYDGLCRDSESGCAKIKAIESGYPYGIPPLEELEKISARIDRESELKAKLSQSAFDGADETKLSRLEEKFSRGVPDVNSLKEIEKEIGVCAALDAEISLAKERELTENELKLKKTFAAGAPAEKELEEIRKKVDALQEAEKKLGGLSAVSTPGTGAEKSYKIYRVVAIAAAVMIAAGIGVIFAQLIAGIVLAACGAACLIADGFLYLNKKSAAAGVSPDGTERVKLSRRIDALSDEVKAFLTPYGYCSSNAAFGFLTFESDLKSYRGFLNAEKKLSETLGEKTAQRDAAGERINAFFAQYGYAQEFLANLSSLRGDTEVYLSLAERKRKSAQNSDGLREKLNENGAEIDAFCKTYRVVRESVRESVKACFADIRTLSDLRAKAAQDKERAEKFKAERKLCERPSGGQEDFDGLNAEISALRDENSRLYREICDDEFQAEKLDGYLADKTAAEEALSAYNKKYALLSACIDCLNRADENLKEKYIKPVRDKFIDYSALLEKALGEKVTMNRDFEISFERSGKERSEKHLSAGQKTVLSLCFRLALIWNMYEKEKPFLILDDPFVSLDAVHLERAKELLGSLSEKMQIIYFTCHADRAV